MGIRSDGDPLGWGSALPHTYATIGRCRRTIFAAFVDVLWALTCALGLSWNLMSLFIATISSITGPGMALRGPEGSLGMALAHMELQQKRAMRFFGRGLVRNVSGRERMGM
mgnify:CR=1 FL=1